jgi:hypothetical protein
MKKVLILLVALMLPVFIFGENYTSLWKKVTAAEDKDLPKTEYEVLQKIVKKAEKGKDYGHLLKAQLLGAQVISEIAPDSLKPEMMRIKERYEQTDDEVLKLVYQTVLYRVGSRYSYLGLQDMRPKLTEELCQKLAQVKEDEYVPFVIKGIDSEIFGRDLLSIVSFELDELGVLYDYYVKTGNRRAACVVASREFRYSNEDKFDELLKEYQDLPEAGELAIARYRRMYSATAEEKVSFIREALGKWGKWKRMNELRNEEKKLTNPEIHLTFDRAVAMPGQSTALSLKDMRNLGSLTMRIYQVNANGDINLNPSNDKDYQALKPKLGKVVNEQTKAYQDKKDYEFFEDNLTIPALPIGVYMLEFTSPSGIDAVRRLYFVTDVFVIAEPQNEGGDERYVVVSARTGQPIAGAHLRIKNYFTYAAFNTFEGMTDEKGEYIFKRGSRNSNRREVFAYTDTDKACPDRSNSSSYVYYSSEKLVTRTEIYTDRSIYRPGQTVHASALTYQVKNGLEQSVCGRQELTFSLYDANYKLISEQQTMTDEYGVAATDFTLPSSGLTGNFQIRVGDQRHHIRVEEYKRPTFYVEFPEVKEAYAAGDTLPVKGMALSYAGVPIQDGKVSFKVVRRTAFWWWSYSRYWDTGLIGYGHHGDEIAKGEVKTDDKGQFVIDVPLTLPETSNPMFYTFVVTADVTDTAGETRSGQLSLPLGNRKTALTVDLQEKILADEKPEFTIHLLNAAGQDIKAQAQYQIDGGAWQTVNTATSIPLTSHLSPLSSGKHTFKAICENDTIERSFVLFSLDDQVPATETDDWFYQSATQFPNDGKPVTIQVGSSDQDVHIVYSIFAGKKLIERGAVDRSNQLFNLNVTYEEEYDNGLLLTFAWVKNQHCYTHTATIQRPLPDKKLKLEWTTFRDRLKPGQQEEWTLSIKDADGKPMDAQLMATLYDKSLDQIVSHQWSLVPYLSLPLPSTVWQYPDYSKVNSYETKDWTHLEVEELLFSKFDESVIPSPYRRHNTRLFKSGGDRMLMDEAVMAEPVMREKMVNAAMVDAEEAKATTEEAETGEEQQMEMRENLNETAFFYPQLTTDKDGRVALKFTLPESLTTWRFMGLAHTKDMYYGSIESLTVAQKDVMIQPNIPRFLREGDQATIAARIFNISEKALTGKAQLRLLNAETNAVVSEWSKPVTIKAGGTTTVAFPVDANNAGLSGNAILICQMMVSGKGFSDGEQHYLPILPASERVTVTQSITQHQPGTVSVDLAKLIPADARQTKLTIEYTDNPAWLMVQSLPSLGIEYDDNAISLAASYYANGLGKYIIDKQPEAKKAFDLWKQETDHETTLMNALEKNQELKDVVLNETPWVLDADNETAQKQRLADFFDDNQMNQRLSNTIDKLRKLQKSDGSWSWWPEMSGSLYMTVAVSEMLVRLNDMVGEQKDTKSMLTNAFRFMGREIVKEVEDMKEWAKDGHEVSFSSFKALQWLYLTTLDGRELPADVQKANSYLLKLLKKDIKDQTMYEKALTAVILSKSEPQRAAEYVQSLKEYTVYREETGRYYDTPRAGYSWFDYTIPTQTVAIEAIQRITPNDKQTVREMQRWLLQEKRTQAWDTPVNSVNAIYAFLMDDKSPLTVNNNHAQLKVDGKLLDAPKATAAIGYVKTSVPATSKTFTVEKTSEDTSWGAVYAQFVQATKNITDFGNGLTVKRELLTANGKAPEALKVGDRVKIRITVTADRDYDFVQVIDKRAACLEPVRQLSGYRNGAYVTPKDNTTNYYFNMMSKGTHVFETEYNIDRTGTYETGTCTVQCAYAPEFRGTTKSQTLIIK